MNGIVATLTHFTSIKHHMFRIQSPISNQSRYLCEEKAIWVYKLHKNGCVLAHAYHSQSRKRNNINRWTHKFYRCKYT